MPAAEFEIREFPESDWLRLTLLGELDLSCASELEARLDELQAEGQSVLVDLSELEFMDSTGLSILVQAINSSRGNGWAFAIDPDLPPDMRSLFRLTCLDQFAGIDGMSPSSA